MQRNSTFSQVGIHLVGERWDREKKALDTSIKVVDNVTAYNGFRPKLKPNE